VQLSLAIISMQLDYLQIIIRARLALRLRLRFIENAVRSCLINRKIDLLFIGPHLISALETQERKNSHFLLFFVFTVHVNCTVQ
jgi:hypothetical protein